MKTIQWTGTTACVSEIEALGFTIDNISSAHGSVNISRNGIAFDMCLNDFLIADPYCAAVCAGYLL